MIYLFFRKNDSGALFFYPVEIPADIQAQHPNVLQDHIDLNPGTVKVEDIDGNVVWSAN